MALVQNQQGVQEILKAIEPRILGKEHGSFKCSCGKYESAPATATSVKPAGTNWAVWGVLMTPKEQGKGRWACGLNEFIPVAELEELFAKHFARN